MKKIYFSSSDQDRNLYAAGNTNEAEQCRKITLACVEAAKCAALRSSLSGDFIERDFVKI